LQRADSGDRKREHLELADGSMPVVFG